MCLVPWILLPKSIVVFLYEEHICGLAGFTDMPFRQTSTSMLRLVYPSLSASAVESRPGLVVYKFVLSRHSDQNLSLPLPSPCACIRARARQSNELELGHPKRKKKIRRTPGSGKSNLFCKQEFGGVQW